MTEAQIYSWIFYAASAVGAEKGVKHREIESVADGINHAVPTQKEISSSMKWLESKGLLRKEGKKVLLTDVGKELATRLKEKPGGVMKVWERITKEFEHLGADNQVNLNCQTMKAEPVRGGNA
ncbi:hypothetical protein, partial [Cerasicoccus frondis]|uniref:hypothetical protein n=1 Tax=Cerasicoccus frondis TaxID=490090 RepID=UPI0028529791